MTGKNKKMQTWRLLPFETYDGYTNMAIDEILMNRVISHQSPNTLRFFCWNPSTATIGKNQSLSAEIDTKFALEHEIQVVRRITGGGAVLHDKRNEITYSVITHLSDIPRVLDSPRVYDQSIPPRYVSILEALAQGLESIGYPIDVGAIHCPALMTQGKKISGNAQAISNNVLLQHGTILLDVDPEFMYSVLKAPEGVSYSKMVQSVRTKVTGLKKADTSEKSRAISPQEIVETLQESFCRIFHINLELQPLSEEEHQEVLDLVASKYKTKKWLQRFL